MPSCQISLQNVGKRYNHEWIFRGLTHTFNANDHTVILGANGSGKSTLLQIILGSTIASEGELANTVNGKNLTVEEAIGKFSLATPYLELIEEFTLIEMLEFHQKMAAFRDGLLLDEIIERLYLSEAKQKAIKYYSSGMKQRVKLGVALMSDTPFVLLDEPTSNLDSDAIVWYNRLVEDYKTDRVIIVCSNDQKQEFSFCSSQLNVGDFK